MADPIELIATNTRWFVGGAFALFSAVVAAEWKFMDGWRLFWKEAFTEKDKELENLKKHPSEAAMKIVEIYKDTVSAQVTKLESEIVRLQDDIAQKTKIISEIMHKSEHDQALFDDEREKLEREVAVYKDMIAKLLARKEQADEIIRVFRTEPFDDPDGLINSTNDEISRQLRQVHETSMVRMKEIWAEQAAESKRAYREQVRQHAEEQARQEAIRRAQEATAKGQRYMTP